MTKTKLGVTKVILSLVLVLALVAGLTVSVAFADEAAPQTRVFDANFDRMLAAASGEGVTPAYRSVSWEAGKCATVSDPVYKIGSPSFTAGFDSLVIEVRSPDQSVKLADLKIGMRDFGLNDDGQAASDSYLLSSDDVAGGLSLSAGTDIGAEWVTITIDFASTEMKVNGAAINTAGVDKIAGFHLYAADATKAGKLDIRKVAVLTGATETVVHDFTKKFTNWWDGSDGTWQDVPACFSISADKQIVSTDAAANNTDGAYDAIVLAIRGTGSVTVAPVVDGTAGTAVAWASLTDLEGTPVAALTDSVQNVVISLQSLGAKNIQGVKVAVTGGTVEVSAVFFTNMQDVSPDKYFPSVDLETIAYLSQFNFEYLKPNGIYETAVEACAAFNLDYILSYHSEANTRITGGHAVLDGTGVDYVSLKIRSKVASEGRRLLVIKYKLENGATLDNFRFSTNNSSDALNEAGVKYANQLQAGTLLPSLSDANPYTEVNGYAYLVVDLEKTFNTTDVQGIELYYTGEGQILIDEIYYANPILPKLDIESKHMFDDYTTLPSAEGSGYWWAHGEGGETVIEDGALKLSAAAGQSTRYGGARPGNNKDWHSKYLVLRMKRTGTISMETFRIGWLDGTFTFFNQGSFVTFDGSTYVLGDEYSDFVIDLEASHVNLDVEGFHIWIGGWADEEGALLIDEAYFIDKLETKIDAEAEIVYDDYTAVPSGDSGYWWTDPATMPANVTVEDGALKVEVAAGAVVCIGGAKPGNNKDSQYRYMIIRMKGTLGMETFRIAWLDDTTTFFNQGAFVTMSGVPYELKADEYTDFIIDLDASGINRAIEGYRLWLGGWNENDGVLYIDKVSFAPAVGDIVVLPTNDDSAPVITTNIVTEGITGKQITLQATAVDNYSSVVTIAYQVTLGSTAVTVTDGKFTPATAGTYAVKVTATDEAGNVAEETVSITVVAPVTLGTPVVTVDKEGNASWAAVEKATGYAYKINGGAEQTTSNLSVQLNGGDTIEVRALGNGESVLSGEFSAAVTYKAPLSAGAIAGIIIACVVIAAGAVVAVILIRKKKNA